MSKDNRFNLSGKVAIITGGAGLLGKMHAEAIAELGGIPILWDINSQEAESVSREISKTFNVKCEGMAVDITDPKSVKKGFNAVLKTQKKIDVLINNAACNQKMQVGDPVGPTRVENFPLEQWQKDFDVSVTGAFICSRVVGSHMAQQESGVIINISSDLGIVAPDQRIYHEEGLLEENQTAKPISYSVVKHAIIGLSKYLATYWAQKNIRVNTLCPGGVFSGQSEGLVGRLTSRIPMGRMAEVDEYKGAIQFLCSDASSYMTGACLNIDGGRTTW